MDFSQFCKNFYLDRGESSLQNHHSQPAIVGFFLKNTLKRQTWENFETTDQDNRKKTNYFNGTKLDKSFLKEISNNLSNKDFKLEFSQELEDELANPDDKNFIETAKKFEIEETKPDKKCFALALAEQLLQIAYHEGKYHNIVPKKYAEYKFQSTAKVNTTANTAMNNPGSSDQESDKEFEEFKKKYVLLTKREFWQLCIAAIASFIAFLIIFVMFMRISTRHIKEIKEADENLLNSSISSYLTSATSSGLQVVMAEKLYDWSKSTTSLGSTNQYRLWSAILKLNSLNDTYGDQKERLATQGLNLCQDIQNSEHKGTPLYHLAIILKCHFYDVLEYDINDETWKTDIAITEEYLSNRTLNMQKNEDALLSSYGYHALLNYYGKKITTDYKSGSEELYKKYVKYYNTYKGNQLLVAYSTGSAIPIFNIDEFATYCEILFRLIDLTPIDLYQSYLVDVINTCTDNIKSYSIPSNTDEVILTSIKADAYYHRALIAEKEINEYDSYDISSAKSDAEKAYGKLLKYNDTNDFKSTHFIINSILKMTKHGVWPYDERDQIIKYGDFVLDLPDWGYPYVEHSNEWKNSICVSCYYVLDHYIDDDFSDLGRRATDQLTPMDTYDLVITENDIPFYKEFFENFPKENDYSYTPEESPAIEQTTEESETSEENK